MQFSVDSFEGGCRKPCLFLKIYIVLQRLDRTMYLNKGLTRLLEISVKLYMKTFLFKKRCCVVIDQVWQFRLLLETKVTKNRSFQLLIKVCLKHFFKILSAYLCDHPLLWRQKRHRCFSVLISLFSLSWPSLPVYVYFKN